MLLTIVWIAIAVFLTYMVCAVSFLHRLKTRHSESWAELGSPWYTGIDAQNAFLLLLIGARSMKGPALKEFGAKLRLLRVLAVVGLILLALVTTLQLQGHQ